MKCHKLSKNNQNFPCDHIWPSFQTTQQNWNFTKKNYCNIVTVEFVCFCDNLYIDTSNANVWLVKAFNNELWVQAFKLVKQKASSIIINEMRNFNSESLNQIISLFVLSLISRLLSVCREKIEFRQLLIRKCRGKNAHKFKREKARVR